MSVQLIPMGYDFDAKPNQDRIEDVTLFYAVDLNDGVVVGEIGVMAPADDKYGYDRLWGWVDTNHDKHTDTAFKTLDDAVTNFLKEVAE